MLLVGCGNCIQVTIALPKADKSSNISDIQVYYGAVFEIWWNKSGGAVVRHHFPSMKSKLYVCVSIFFTLIMYLVFLSKNQIFIFSAVSHCNVDLTGRLSCLGKPMQDHLHKFCGTTSQLTLHGLSINEL